MNIGIGFGFSSKNGSFWNNESLQNSIFLYFMLKDVKYYNVFLVNFGIEIEELSYQNKFFLKDINIVDWKDVVKTKNNINILINPNLFINDKIIEYLKSKNTKLIRIDHTNNYNTDLNDILINPKNLIFKNIYDEIWIYQNNIKNNKTYLETIYDSNIEVMPFIWDSYFIRKQKILEKNTIFNYVEHEKKDVTIFDSNNTVYDMCIYSLLLLEKSYNSNKELFKEKINKIRFINSLKLRNNIKFLSIINKLNIMKDGFCSFEDNYDSYSILSRFTDVVVSNQLDDQLKYFYFESLYGSYPLIHNSELLKSNGYYYNDVRINEFAHNFISIIENHYEIMDRYNMKFGKILPQYSIKTKSILDKYSNKIEKLIKI